MIEVVRVIRYRYKDAERMSDDMSRWTLQHKDSTMQMESHHFNPDWSSEELNADQDHHV